MGDPLKALWAPPFLTRANIPPLLSDVRASRMPTNPASLPYVHQRCVSFHNSAARRRYLERCTPLWYEDVAARDTFEELWRAPKGNANSWIALLAVPQADLSNQISYK